MLADLSKWARLGSNTNAARKGAQYLQQGRFEAANIRSIFLLGYLFLPSLFHIIGPARRRRSGFRSNLTYSLVIVVVVVVVVVDVVVCAARSSQLAVAVSAIKPNLELGFRHCWRSAMANNVIGRKRATETD